MCEMFVAKVSKRKRQLVNALKYTATVVWNSLKTNIEKVTFEREQGRGKHSISGSTYPLCFLVPTSTREKQHLLSINISKPGM